MFIYKRWINFEILKDVAHTKSLPRPLVAKNWNGRGSSNFWATPLKFSKFVYFLKMLKWYYYHILLTLMVSILKKMLTSSSPSYSSLSSSRVMISIARNTCKITFDSSPVFFTKTFACVVITNIGIDCSIWVALAFCNQS